MNPQRLVSFIRSSLAARLFLVVAATVVVPAALLFVTALSLFEGAVKQSMEAELGSALDRSERDLTQFLADLVAVTGVLATDEEMARALVSDEAEYRRVRAVDRSVDVALAAMPGRDSIRFTILGSGRIYTSWSRNFRDYSFISGLPLPSRAGKAGGHLVWQGFGPSFVTEEGERELLVSVARAMSAPSAGPPGIVIVQAEREAFRKYFRERRASASISTLLVANGQVLMDTTQGSGNGGAAGEDSAGPLAFAREIAVAGKGDRLARIGTRFAAGRRLMGLPPELLAQDWTLLILYDYGDLGRRFARLRAFFVPSFSILLLLALGASWIASRRIIGPLHRLSARMESWSPEKPLADIGACMPGRLDEIGVLDRSFRRLEGKVLELLSSLQREHEVKELYRFRALSAQLNPHFLFNSLNSLRWMAILRKADNIVQAIDHLSVILSHSMGKGGDRSTLCEEVRSVESYLAIQNLRYGGRFTLEASVPDRLLDMKVLRFMLQPLVENCVLHGYCGASGAGRIEISAVLHGDFLAVDVADRGKGLRPDEATSLGDGPAIVDDPSLEREAGSGLGLSNVRDMLRIVHGTGATLELVARPGGGSVACMRIPIKEGEGLS